MSFAFSRLSDPTYFAENRLPAVSDFQGFASHNEAACGISSRRMSLNGPWHFFFARTADDVPQGFEDPTFDVSAWDTIPVPAHMQLHGYGVPQYCNVQYPWDGWEDVPVGAAPVLTNHVGCYVRMFSLPEGMPENVSVVFHGAESCVAVWLNGHYVGFAAGSFSPSTFDVSAFIQPGENRLACRVYRFCAGSWLEDQDFFRFSGLFRDVELVATPCMHISDLEVHPDVTEGLTSGVLHLKLSLSQAKSWQMRISLAREGEEVFHAALHGDKACAQCAFSLPQVRLWSCEDPCLYDLTLELLDAEGSTLEVVPQRIGFRRIEIRENVLLLNGKRLVIKGVNRHDFSAGTGRAVTEDVIRDQLLQMKRMHINAVRTSHYPNHEALYRLCDELGLYVMDENNLETHGVWDRVTRGLIPLSEMVPGDKPEWRASVLDRVTSLVRRDRNHLCVLLWSLGNESLGGSVLHEAANLVRRLDPTRPVHYEGVCHDARFPDTTDLESMMYESPAHLRERIAGPGKPFILCEYAHAMGNSTGNLSAYTELAWEPGRYQGGFIWDFIDQALMVPGPDGRQVLRYGGDFSDRPHDGWGCGNGLLFADGTPSPKVQAVSFCYQDIRITFTETLVHIENRHLFTDSSAYACVLTRCLDGIPCCETTLETHVPPLEARGYAYPFPQPTQPGEYTDTLSFRLREDRPWAKRGEEIAFGQRVFRILPGLSSPVRLPPLCIVRGIRNLGVHTDDSHCLFSDLGLSCLRRDDSEYLLDVPRPYFWRPPTDNDRGNRMPARCGQWKLASQYVYRQDLFSGTAYPTPEEHPDGSVSLTYTYVLPTRPAASCDLSCTVSPSGEIRFRLSMEPDPELPELPTFGLLFRLPPALSTLRFYGLGPEENEADREQGARLGIFERDVARVTPYLKPQSCGTHAGVRWASLTDRSGHGLRFASDGMFLTALPVSPYVLEETYHVDELPPHSATYVICAGSQMGVGGDDSWGAYPHDEYRLPSGRRYIFDMCLRLQD